jgi:Rho-binding antiterminator
MKSGSVIEGKAVNTARNNSHQECIKIEIDNVEKLIVLEEIAILEATIKNPHFQSVILN